MTRYISNKIENLIEITKNNKIKLVRAGKSLRMHNHKDPCCIADVEFDFIYDFVKKHKLMNGYEIATAFGVSMLAAALAMKEYGGRLVTMDAYIEEEYNHCMKYIKKTETFNEADGFDVALYLINSHNLEKTVYLHVGFSPINTKDALEGKFDLTKEKLDYVFIDGLHTDDAVKKDLVSILPYLNKDRYAVFFHDTHCFNDETKIFIQQKLGKPLKLIPKCEHPGDGFNLAVVTNLE